MDSVAYRLEHFVLDPANRAVKFKRITEKGPDIATGVLDDDLTLTIEGASTIELTVYDPKLTLLNGDLLTGWTWGTNADDRDEAHWILDGRTVDAQLDDLWFRQVKVSKQSFDTLLLTFEDREVAKLRAHKGARKMYRDQFTRAQFVKALLDAAGVPSFIPELHKRQPIAKSSQKVSDFQRTQTGGKGLDAGADITVKGDKPNREQRANIERVLDAGASRAAPQLADLAALVAGILESDFKKGAVNGPYKGVFQSNQIPGSDLEQQAAHFYDGGKGFQGGGAIHLARTQPHLSAGDIAHKVEAGQASPGDYNKYLDEARKILKAYDPSGVGGDLTVTVEKPFAFARGKNEDSWDAIQRLAGEVNFRAFIRKGVGWYVSEEYLFAQKPQLQLVERQGPVDEITFDIDIGARDLIQELQATVHVARWTALPGMVGRVKGQGPADGRWILHELERPLDDDTATATFNKPIPIKPEPAAETEDVTLTTGAVASDASGPVGEALAKAIGISKRNMPYVWGGGHNARFAPNGGGYDCSGYVSAILHAAGLLDSPLTSSGLESWGKAGKGRYMTVYANAEHTFIVFHGLGRYKRADTSPQGGETQRGPHVRVHDRSTAGFVARHWPGL